MKQSRIALTGASGLLGRAILQDLQRRGNVAVLAIYRSPTPDKDQPNITHFTTDLTQANEIDRALAEFAPTVFIHTAATGMQSPSPETAILNDVNVELPVRLAEAVRKISGCHFVHASSGLVYENRDQPVREDDAIGTQHPYGASKVEAEQRLRELARDRQFPLTIVRPFSFTGPGDFGTRLFPSLLRSAIEGVPFQMSAGEQVRDHSSVNDIARGIIAAALQGGAGNAEPQIFNLGSGDTRALRDLVSTVVQQLDLNIDIQFGAKPHSRTEPMFSVSDSSRAREQLGWRPQESVAQAVWQLARTSFPALKVKEPTGSA